MTAPSDEVFEEMRKIAISIWSTYDDTFKYATKKIDFVNSINNVEDNAMVFYRMFDSHNQYRFRESASKEILEYIRNNN